MSFSGFEGTLGSIRKSDVGTLAHVIGYKIPDAQVDRFEEDVLRQWVTISDTIRVDLGWTRMTTSNYQSHTRSIKLTFWDHYTPSNKGRALGILGVLEFRRGVIVNVEYGKSLLDQGITLRDGLATSFVYSLLVFSWCIGNYAPYMGTDVFWEEIENTGLTLLGSRLFMIPVLISNNLGTFSVLNKIWSRVGDAYDFRATVYDADMFPPHIIRAIDHSKQVAVIYHEKASEEHSRKVVSIKEVDVFGKRELANTVMSPGDLGTVVAAPVTPYRIPILSSGFRPVHIEGDLLCPNLIKGCGAGSDYGGVHTEESQSAPTQKNTETSKRPKKIKKSARSRDEEDNSEAYCAIS